MLADRVRMSGREILGSIVTDGLILHLDAKTGSGSQNIWEDQSINTNNGTLVNFNHDLGSGWLEDSLAFDGINDYVNIPSHSSLNLTSAITAELSLVLGEADTIYPVFIAKRTLSYSWEMGVGANKRLIGRINSNTYMATGTTILQPHTKYHLVMTYDRSYIRVYVNGNFEGSYSYSSAINTNTAPVTIGRRSLSGAEEWFRGTVSNVRIYNRALSADEIWHNYLI